MANILEKYGIKEVADVMFYEIGSNGQPTKPVLYLDTLKVSTIEQTAEESEARGGKGNPALIIWDYGREINVTLEDALFSAKSMAIMFGNNPDTLSSPDYIRKTITYVANSTTDAGPTSWTGPDGATHTIEDLGDNPNLKIRWYEDNGQENSYTGESKADKGTPPATFKPGITYFKSFYIKIKDATVIEISPNTFPKNYYVTGDTYARKQATGEDEFFQFIIPCAKVQSEQTFTLEAEGDPTVFNLNLRVLRPGGNEHQMMKLVKYSLDETKDESTSLVGITPVGKKDNTKDVPAEDVNAKAEAAAG